VCVCVCVCVCARACAHMYAYVHKGEAHGAQEPSTRFKVGTDHGPSEARTGKDKLILGHCPWEGPMHTLKINDTGKLLT
jgi:hypothetical protein